MGILFNSTALGIHFCETSLIFNFKTRLGGEICLCDVDMHKGYSERNLSTSINPQMEPRVSLSLLLKSAPGLIKRGPAGLCRFSPLLD